MADCGKQCALIIGLGLEPHEGFEIVFLRQAAEKLCGHVRASMAVRVDNNRVFPQDAQKGCPARPQRATKDGYSKLARLRHLLMARMSPPLRVLSEALPILSTSL